jgi:hypothetical protein
MKFATRRFCTFEKPGPLSDAAPIANPGLSFTWRMNLPLVYDQGR